MSARPPIFETPRVRVRRVMPRGPYAPRLVVEQFFSSYPGRGSWTRLMEYELAREADAIECAKVLDRGGSFAQWRDMRKAKDLPR